MKNKMKAIIKKIDWLRVFVYLSAIFCVWVCVGIYNKLTEPMPQEYYDKFRKAKICLTYSNDFWRNDVDFIDGKCYYEGKEVEIK